MSSQSDIIINILPKSFDAKKTVLIKEGVIEGVLAEQILIDMNSITPLVSQKVAKEPVPSSALSSE